MSKVAKRSGEEGLKRVFETAQPMRTARIITMLGYHGYRPKSQNGSHIKLEHGETGRVVIFPHGTTNPIYQKKAAKACLAVEAGQHEPAVPKAKNGSSNGAEKATLRKMLLREAVPDDVEVVDVPGCPSLVALRHALLPVTGIIASADKLVESEIERLLEKLNQEVGSFTAFLKENMDEYKLVLNKTEDEQYFLSQPDYELELLMPFYNGTNIKDVRTEITNFTDVFSNMDKNVSAAIKHIIEYFEMRGKVRKTIDKNGAVEWLLEKDHAITGEKVNLKFTGSPEFRATMQKSYGFLDSFFRLEITKPDDHKYYSNILKNYLGIEVHRPREGKKPGPNLVITHPFYPEINYIMPAPSEVPHAARILKGAETEDPEELFQLEITLQQLMDDLSECFWVNNQIIDDFNTLIGIDSERFHSLFAATMSMQGAEKDFKCPNKHGETGTLTLTHPLFADPVIVKFIWTADKNAGLGGMNKSESYSLMTDPRDLDKWEEALKHMQAAAPQISLDAAVDFSHLTLQ
ncbi:MAG: type II toxin-antitoxin system HicA family toxin [Alphaproteobacteria bacterium]